MDVCGTVWVGGCCFGPSFMCDYRNFRKQVDGGDDKEEDRDNKDYGDKQSHRYLTDV